LLPEHGTVVFDMACAAVCAGQAKAYWEENGLPVIGEDADAVTLSIGVVEALNPKGSFWASYVPGVPDCQYSSGHPSVLGFPHHTPCPPPHCCDASMSRYQGNLTMLFLHCPL
jgi:hypothetical protein